MWWMYMFVYTLYKLCLPAFVWWTCVVFVYMYAKWLYIVVSSHCWMASGKISCEFTGSLSLNKVFELNWKVHLFRRSCPYEKYRRTDRVVFFLAFDFCRFCVVIRFFHPRHNGQWPPTSKDFLSQILSITFIFLS